MNRTAAVITVSDKGARGERRDTSGPAVRAMLEEAGFRVVHTAMVPDEREKIQQALIRCADELGTALAVTTGGTGFSPRDVTPEATRAVVERETPGLPEAMRADSMRRTPRGCLSRGTAGIRGRTLILNLPGSERAARENLAAVLPAVGHGVDMLRSDGSSGCAAPPPEGEVPPSLDGWLREAKAAPDAHEVGIYLAHNGVVRSTARAQARQGVPCAQVAGMRFSYDPRELEEAVRLTRELPGVCHVRAWLNRGELKVGDDLMLVLVGGDTRPHTVDALQFLVERLKTRCVAEEELYRQA